MTAMIPAWDKGALTPVEKLDVHQRGLKHMAVSVFVVRDEHVLIQQRAMGKYHTPGLWANTCCTHPEWDEDPAECAVRRLREEMGVRGLYPAHRGTVEYRAEVGGGMIEHEVVDIFVASAPRDLVIQPNPDEVLDYKWVELYELAARVRRRPFEYTPWLRIYLDNHAEAIFGALVRA